MKFAHLADCHIGGWRENKLKEIGIKAFKETIDICIKENTAFVLISGDLFNTSFPSIDVIKEVTEQLERLRNNDISVYIIPGSHDFSPSGKTMLDVLESSGLVENVFKINNNQLIFTVDKTGTKITGILGKRISLDKKYYENLDLKGLEQEKGFKIFMFHTTVDELKPKEFFIIQPESIKNFPKNFNYYAGGHVHTVVNKEIPNYGLVSYPGPLFPNNFMEIEKLKHGGFYLVDVNEKINLKYIPIKFHDVVSFSIDVNGKNAQEAEEFIKEEINKENVNNKIVTLRVFGTLSSGKPSDINFKGILDELKDPYYVMRNTSELLSKEFEEIQLQKGSVDEVENEIIEKNLGKIQIKNINEDEVTKELIKSLNIEKDEGEKNIDFEDRILSNFVKIFNLKDIWKDDNT